MRKRTAAKQIIQETNTKKTRSATTIRDEGRQLKETKSVNNESEDDSTEAEEGMYHNNEHY